MDPLLGSITETINLKTVASGPNTVQCNYYSTVHCRISEYNSTVQCVSGMSFYGYTSYTFQHYSATF